MGLKASATYRCLDRKTTVFGFEIADLFAAFAALAVLNFVFGAAPFKFLFTWAPAVSLAVFLRIGKAGKPENYLLHWARYHCSPGIFSAFRLAEHRQRVLRKNEGT